MFANVLGKEMRLGGTIMDALMSRLCFFCSSVRWDRSAMGLRCGKTYDEDSLLKP